MREFFRRLFLKFKKSSEDEHKFSSIVYLDEQGNFEMEVVLVCSCQETVNIVDMDDYYDPPIPHFECLHCDRVCTTVRCKACEIYSQMVNARDIATEG